MRLHVCVHGCVCLPVNVCMISLMRILSDKVRFVQRKLEPGEIFTSKT